MPTLIEQKLSEQQLEKFLSDLHATPGTRTLRVIQELAARYGIKISGMAASSFRDGPLEEYLTTLKAKSERAQRVAAYAREGVSMTEAASIRLQESVFDKLMSGDVEDLTAEERNIYSLIIERARLGDQRGAKLAADLKLRDEQLAELRAEREKREASLRAAAAALQKTTDKPKASPDEIRSQAVALIDEVMGIKPKAKTAAPAK